MRHKDEYAGSWLQTHAVLVGLIAAIVGVYYVGIRPVRAVKYCHFQAQQSAKESMVVRSQGSPTNQEFKQAAEAGMFVEQDYVTYYRNCLRAKGYDPEN